jgi:hypothetical protein
VRGRAPARLAETVDQVSRDRWAMIGERRMTTQRFSDFECHALTKTESPTLAKQSDGRKPKVVYGSST